MHFRKTGFHVLPLLLGCILSILLHISLASNNELYEILGVKRTATVKEIKQAYRRKALDTHPDKNKNIPPEEAAEAFHKVVHAFEVLSDDATRKRYDQTGKSDPNDPGGSNGGQQQRWSQQFHFHWNFHHRTFRLKDKFEVQQAQSRVLHVVSVEQLKTIMLDDNDKLEKNLLIAFVTPGDVEQHTTDEMVFPYPFAAMSSQGIWWEDLLQTIQVRFHRASEITRLFGIPSGDVMRSSGEPIFVFGKRGEALENAANWARIETRDRRTFENWVWQCIEVQVQFVNDHSYAVEVYWIHGNRATLKATIEPGDMTVHTTMLSHEFYVRDSRVDTRADSPGRYKLTENSSLGSWKIVNDTSPQVIIIGKQDCFDLSGHCAFWDSHGECTKNPRFMEEQCRKTCFLCSSDHYFTKSNANGEL